MATKFNIIWSMDAKKEDGLSGEDREKISLS